VLDRCLLCCHVCSRLAAGEVEYIVQVLLRAFQSSLLQTYKSKFTQVRGRGHGSLLGWELI
jgi:hypothetical protein